MLFVFALMALFASGLVFEVIGAYGGRELVREIWYWIYLGLFHCYYCYIELNFYKNILF